MLLRRKPTSYTGANNSGYHTRRFRVVSTVVRRPFTSSSESLGMSRNCFKCDIPTSKAVSFVRFLPQGGRERSGETTGSNETAPVAFSDFSKKKFHWETKSQNKTKRSSLISPKLSDSGVAHVFTLLLEKTYIIYHPFSNSFVVSNHCDGNIQRVMLRKKSHRHDHSDNPSRELTHHLLLVSSFGYWSG